MNFNTEYGSEFIRTEELDKIKKDALKNLTDLKQGVCKGNDFLGWTTLPNISKGEVSKIQEVANGLKQFETVVVIGIGGSYLGAKALIDLFTPYFDRSQTEVLFAGHHLDETYLSELIAYLKNKDFALIPISKSGTTLEPAIAFRFLLNLMIEQFGTSELQNRVVTITDKSKGALRQLTDEYQLRSFIVPDDVGGRFSVLSPVGLLPIAIAGVDIQALLQGAKEGMLEYLVLDENNPAIEYSAIRNYLYRNGFTTELMVYSNPKWNAFSEWWKQLFGESEGKGKQGIFPASINITTDLHSLGQYVQDGKRNLFETFIRFSKPSSDINVPNSQENYDKLNYLSGKSMYFINAKAEEGTIKAHTEGGVPVLEIEMDILSEKTVGKLIAFYEVSCAVSGLVLGVNPFDQPGVEAYKNNMFRLLGKI